jgi:hypothetical protein
VSFLQRFRQVGPELDQQRAGLAVVRSGDVVAGLGLPGLQDGIGGQIVAGRLATEGLGVFGGVRARRGVGRLGVFDALRRRGGSLGVAPPAAIRARTPWDSLEAVTASSASLPVRTASAWIWSVPTLFFGRVVAASERREQSDRGDDIGVGEARAGRGGIGSAGDASRGGRGGSA